MVSLWGEVVNPSECTYQWSSWGVHAVAALVEAAAAAELATRLGAADVITGAALLETAREDDAMAAAEVEVEV
jgi:hypothetical protein